MVATSPVKDGRRVLGDKTPNASWSPAKKQTVDLEKPKSTVIPLKPLRESPKPRTLSPPPCHAGQKRTIDQVDENADNSDPRKALITSSPQREGKFQIFEDTTRQAAPSQTQVRCCPQPWGTRDAWSTNTSATIQDPHPDAIEPQTPKMDAPPRQNKESSQDRRSQSPERVDAVPASRVPTEPEARRRFIQEVCSTGYSICFTMITDKTGFDRKQLLPSGKSRRRCVAWKKKTHTHLTVPSPNSRLWLARDPVLSRPEA